MFKARRRLIVVATNICVGLIFVFLTLYIIPKTTFGFSVGIAGVIFTTLLLISVSISNKAIEKIQNKILTTHETGLLNRFIERLRTAYTVDDFIEAIHDTLEDKADCSVLYVDSETNYVIYNSPTRIVAAEGTAEKLEMNYTSSWKDGVYFLSDEFGVVSNLRDARGFFLVSGNKHLYIFCRYTYLFDHIIYERLFEEFQRFETRSKTISDLGEIAALSQEWEHLAETQRSFLPQTIPQIEKLDIAAYFRPLVNVSGDYYTVLPMDEHKTLVMLGDVSGKGLAAALVMGLVMNTVKIIGNKEDLAGVVKAIDKAIKGMHLQDKYTVLFIGIIDTEKMTIRYVNASMSDPIIVTRAPDGYKIKPLTSNCSLIGIIDLDEVEVAEQRLFRDDLILMASDGVSEVMDENGVELGDTELYLNTIKNSAYKSAHHIINDIADLVFSYNGDKKLRDDVTMLTVKVEG
ncbi:MAG: SpoIIE family protein phosphatase [Spirochaetaceae bacterium]|nr:SpoIIE family protein phosphatase [Spirochaetaceae bacterium]